MAGEESPERATERCAASEGPAGCEIEEIAEGVTEAVTDGAPDGVVERTTAGSDETAAGEAADGIEE